MTPQSGNMPSFRYQPAITPFHEAGQKVDRPIGYFRQVAYFARAGFVVSLGFNIVLSFFLLLSALSPKVHLLTAEMLDSGFVPMVGRLTHQTYSNSSFREEFFSHPIQAIQDKSQNKSKDHEKK